MYGGFGMPLDSGEKAKLRQLISIAQKMIAASTKAKRGRPTGSRNRPKKRVRRTGKELMQFRRMLRAERKRGVPVAELAAKHGISTAYIYLL